MGHNMVTFLVAVCLGKNEFQHDFPICGACGAGKKNKTKQNKTKQNKTTEILQSSATLILPNIR
jgi:hypothetical protein